MEQSFPLVPRGSTSFDSALTTQERPAIIPYPSAPAPDATPQQVREFCKQCFLVHRTNLSEIEAEKEAALLAEKLRVAGSGLYELSKETLVGTFGAEGEIIYHIVQSGQPGYVSRYTIHHFQFYLLSS